MLLPGGAPRAQDGAGRKSLGLPWGFHPEGPRAKIEGVSEEKIFTLPQVQWHCVHINSLASTV